MEELNTDQTPIEPQVDPVDGGFHVGVGPLDAGGGLGGLPLYAVEGFRYEVLVVLSLELCYCWLLDRLEEFLLQERGLHLG